MQTAEEPRSGQCTERRLSGTCCRAHRPEQDTEDALGHPLHPGHYSSRLNLILPLNHMESGQESQAGIVQLALT